MKQTIGLVLVMIAGMLGAVEKNETAMPISGGFGITLGEKLTPKLAEQLKATKEKADRDDYYSVTPPKPLGPFDRYSVMVNTDNRIYKIQALYIDRKWESGYSVAIGAFGEKYGPLKRDKDDAVIIDKNAPTRTITITQMSGIAAIVYSDAALLKNDGI